MDFNSILKQFENFDKSFDDILPTLEKDTSSTKTEKEDDDKHDENKVVQLRNLRRGHKPTYERAKSSEKTSLFGTISEEKGDTDIGSVLRQEKRGRDSSNLRKAHFYPPGMTNFHYRSLKRSYSTIYIFYTDLQDKNHKEFHQDNHLYPILLVQHLFLAMIRKFLMNTSNYYLDRKPSEKQLENILNIFQKQKQFLMMSMTQLTKPMPSNWKTLQKKKNLFKKKMMTKHLSMISMKKATKAISSQ